MIKFVAAIAIDCSCPRRCNLSARQTAATATAVFINQEFRKLILFRRSVEPVFFFFVFFFCITIASTVAVGFISLSLSNGGRARELLLLLLLLLVAVDQNPQAPGASARSSRGRCCCRRQHGTAGWSISPLANSRAGSGVSGVSGGGVCL